METFWSTLKREIAWIRGSIWFPTRADAQLYLFEFIEVFYPPSLWWFSGTTSITESDANHTRG
jgi:hypothetical protein